MKHTVKSSGGELAVSNGLAVKVAERLHRASSAQRASALARARAALAGGRARPKHGAVVIALGA